MSNQLRMNLLEGPRAAGAGPALAPVSKPGLRVVRAVVDSGAVDHVVNPRRLRGHTVHSTEDSLAGASWECAGGSKLEKLGKVKLS